MSPLQAMNNFKEKKSHNILYLIYTSADKIGYMGKVSVVIF